MHQPLPTKNMAMANSLTHSLTLFRSVGRSARSLSARAYKMNGRQRKVKRKEKYRSNQTKSNQIKSNQINSKPNHQITHQTTNAKRNQIKALSKHTQLLLSSSLCAGTDRCSTLPIIFKQNPLVWVSLYYDLFLVFLFF